MAIVFVGTTIGQHDPRARYPGVWVHVRTNPHERFVDSFGQYWYTWPRDWFGHPEDENERGRCRGAKRGGARCRKWGVTPREDSYYCPAHAAQAE